ncbi:class I SAM-dependent methyltransferase [Sagittula sp. S175]|uniref:class I SAM-dependent methyltransferase n=1 Tax=Sagittula sp. S175 TaxID=3415129 RepID=UPI003C7CDBFB
MIEKILRRVAWRRDLDLQHVDRIRKWGHRHYVGGDTSEAWYGIGKRQYHFLASQGLRAEHVFVDIACGSLRLGQYLIPMLEEGNYFGLEGEPDLVKAGLEHELLFDLADKKAPRFAYNYGFAFEGLEQFDYAIAQSLFTHLTLDDIETCFRNLRGHAHAGSKFFSTFFEGDPQVNPDAESHANKDWYYPFEAFREIGERTGWAVEYIGDWGHERDQKMICATPSGH